MSAAPAPGELLWSPPPDARDRSRIAAYLDWLRRERGLDFDGYEELWRWSVGDLEAFWGSIWHFHGVHAHAPYERVLGSRDMPGARWFPGARLNYAEHALGTEEDTDAPAILGRSQTRPPVELSFGELREQVARARAGLRALGVRPGDRVVAYLPNIPETVVAFLATASLGAIWASCAPEFGARSVIDRFGQIEPMVLLAVTGYRYGDRAVDRRAELAEIRAALPTLRHVVALPYGEHAPPEDALSWGELLADRGPLEFEPVAFEHPLCVLFSSGTTGLPKAIVHGHGGVLLEHLKDHSLSWDLGPGDRLQWFTTTAWMMWNAMVSALLLRASIVTIDGNPAHPGVEMQWALAAETRPSLLGVSPAFVMACRKAGLEPGREYDLSSIRQVGAAGSPLPPEGYAWVLDQLADDVLPNVGSGGTDVCSGLVGGNPLRPVWAGEMSGPALGVDARAFDPTGRPVVGELGELVILQPLPSMPVGFWNDPGDRRLRAAYFEDFPGVWRHGDWIRFTERGSCVITGRSDATLNRGGVRLGTAEFYAVVEDLDEVLDSLVVHLEDGEGGPGELLLFVALRDGVPLDDELRRTLARRLRESLSPRHVPDTVVAVHAVPRTLTGKKLEVPVKRILLGARAEEVASPDALADARSLDAYVAYAAERRALTASRPPARSG